MKIKKASKVLAFALALAVAAIPAMVSAATIDPSTGIGNITYVAGTTDLTITVPYTMTATTNDQVTILVTKGSLDVTYSDVEQTMPDNIVYIDQVAYSAASSFSFVVDKPSDVATYYVKIGGTGITAPASGYKDYDPNIVPIVIYGDVNGDGIVNAMDGSLVLQRYAGTLTAFPVGSDIPGDVNGDGVINAMDDSLILQYYAGTLIKFPAQP